MDRFALESTDPSRLFLYRDGVHAAYLLAAAIVEFDFFTWLEKNPSSFADICKGLEIAERPTDVMLTLFRANGFVTKENDIYSLSETGRTFLTSHSPYSLLPYYSAPFADRQTTKDFIHVLRTNEPSNWETSSKNWHESMEDDAFAESFTAKMDCRGRYLGTMLAKNLSLDGFSHLLDIGGSSGIYACCFVESNPQLKATIFEKPPVDRWSRKSIEKRGLADRVSVAGGDMFKDPYPTDCDVHLLSHVIHDWDYPEVEKLVKKSFDALSPGGMLIIHGAHINEEKDGPLAVAEYSTLLVQCTQGKCYSFGEMRDCLEKAGFSSVTYKDNACNRSFITGRKN
jgi:SAM-dependent methyltransferase